MRFTLVFILVMVAYHTSISQKVHSYRGIFIGINNYESSPHQPRKLHYAVNDAKAVYDSLKSSLTESTLLLNEEATYEAILGVFADYVTKSERGDLLIFFVATHGTTSFDDFFILPYNSRLDEVLATGVPASMLMSLVYQKAGLNVAMIFDACHAGAIGFDPVSAQSRIALMFAASPSEDALESNEYLGHGLFTSHFLKSLSVHNDINNNGYVSMMEAFNYTFPRVTTDSRGLQNPVLLGSWPEVPIKVHDKELMR